jgi:hypothetical protein
MSELCAPYMAMLRQCPGVHVRVFVNDVPMYDRAVMGYSTPTFPATPWLQAGENEIVIECRESPKNPEMVLVPAHFQCKIIGQGAVEADDKLVYFEEYPTFLPKLPEEERKLPCSIRGTFTAEGVIPKPIWADSSPGPVPERGSPELLKTVFGLHQAFAKRDGDALLELGSLKIEDLQRYFGKLPSTDVASLRKENEEMFKEPWDVMPFRPEDLRFRSCAMGRVAYATSVDGGPALLARHKTDPGQVWAVRPLLLRQGADWRIFR